MQCFICGESMRVVMVEPHDVIQIAGFELRTFQCIGCGDVEKRMAFDNSLSHQNVALVSEAAGASGGSETTEASAPNSRVKAILGSLVRLRGHKSGN